jgi:cystathionine beta-lyase/cystathionine gamma-synthase
MARKNPLGFSTRAIHAGVEPDPHTGSIMTPVHLTSTYVQEEFGRHRGHVYSRVSNPTRTALERNVAALEGAREALAFGSGMAAISALFHLLKSGDHVVVSRNVYGGTWRLAKLVLEDFDLAFDFVDTTKPSVVAASIRPATRMVFVETPTNPTMEITDLAAVAKLCRERHVLSIVDNTFATPYLQNPLAFGIDVVMHSATKYLNGHSDMLGGMLALDGARVVERLRFVQKSVGAIMSPFEAWLCLRGIKTLAVRMERHCANGAAVARVLDAHPRVRTVHYPGLTSHPQHRLARRQMRGFGGMIAFDLGSLASARRFLNRVRLCALAESLGGVETLVCHPATMTHAAVPAAERRRIGVGDGLVRISVGIEDVDDIVDDVRHALG